MLDPLASFELFVDNLLKTASCHGEQDAQLTLGVTVNVQLEEFDALTSPPNSKKMKKVN